MRPLFLISTLIVTLVLLQGATQKVHAAGTTPLQRAMKYFDEKKYDSAVVLLRQAWHKEPSNINVRYEMALAFALLKQQDSAISVLNEIKDKSEATDKYYQLLANCYAEKDDTVRAREVLMEGTKRFQNSGKLHMELGVLQLQQHHLEEALDEFEEGIQVEPSYLSNYYWAARVYAPGNEKIWTVLYAEVVMNNDPNPSHVSLMSTLLYAAHNSCYDEFKKTRKMVYSKARKGAADATQAQKESFEDLFNAGMTRGAEPLRFFQDFEIPLASIDTMQTLCVKEWFAKGNDKKFPNAVLDRHKQLLDAGLHTAYTFHLLQFAKPLEFKTYIDQHRKDYVALIKWLSTHPLEITTSNRFSRFSYN